MCIYIHEGVRYLGAGGTGGQLINFKRGGQNSGPLQEQQVLVTAELPL